MTRQLALPVLPEGLPSGCLANTARPGLWWHFSPSTEEAEAGGIRAGGQVSLHSEFPDGQDYLSIYRAA